MKRCFISAVRVVGKLLAAVLAVLAVFSVSPIYDFCDIGPFSGPDIFNPYSTLETPQWKKANFHTHTRVKGPLNECELWPEDVLEDYRKLDYDILTFSNHNKLTKHPTDSTLQVNVYEHGFNFLKYHKLVFGAEKVWHYDHLLPFLASQRQWQLDMLDRQSDFQVLNHPYRTPGSTRRIMSRLDGYELIELDSGAGDRQEYWDWALTAGHYSFAIANDDCHDSRNTRKIARRATFIQTPSAGYKDLWHILTKVGCFYCMRIPDYGDGDWDVKREANRHLPFIEKVDVSGDTIDLVLSAPALVLEARGAFRERPSREEDDNILKQEFDSAHIRYVLPSDEPYVRFTAYFGDGAILYTNAFARYDASKQDNPFCPSHLEAHSIDIPLTIAYNLALLIVFVLCLYVIFRRPKKRVIPA